MPFSVFLIFFLLFSTTCVAFNDSGTDIVCRTWMYRANASSPCVCGHSLKKAVLCDPSTYQVKVLKCHMLTYSPRTKEVLAGYSLFSCRTLGDADPTLYIPVPSNVSQLNFKMCDSRKREGLLCGKCQEDHWPLFYSHKLECTKCSDTEMRENWFLFIAVAFVPVTLFYMFVVIFKFNANSPSLHGFITLAQLLTQTYNVKQPYKASADSENTAEHILQALYNVWNLSFFRAFGPNICLHISNLEALILEYAIAFYPMILILITYVIIELYSRGFRIIIMIWRPFQQCAMYFRKNWNIKPSLIDAFATFLLLSYNRLLDISFSLLMYTTVYNSRGEAVGRYLYYESSKEFLGEEHLPYGILAVLVLSFFNIVPLLLLLFYPMSWFQRCLNCTRLNCFALHTFVDAFTGCYKDGTEPGTRDYRYFATFFLLLRFANYITIAYTYDDYYSVVLTIILVHFSIIFMIVQPYRSKFAQHNTTAMAFLLLGICYSCCVYGLRYTVIIRPQSSASLVDFMFIIASLPHIYIAYLIIRFVCRGVQWRKFCCEIAKFKQPNNKFLRTHGYSSI